MDLPLPPCGSARRAKALAAAPLLALLLAGCGSSARDRLIEERIAAAEAKAAAAEKRAQEAELAAAQLPTPSPTATETEAVDDEKSLDEQGEDALPTDPDSDDNRFDNEIVAPAAAPVADADEEESAA